MVKQYPDIITSTLIGPTTKDAMGNPIPGEATTRQDSCRAEVPNTQAKFIDNADGQSIPVSYIIYLPLGVPPIPVGTLVDVTRDGEPYCSGEIKRFYPGQLNNRIWL